VHEVDELNVPCGVAVKFISLREIISTISPSETFTFDDLAWICAALALSAEIMPFASSSAAMKAVVN
jgi:hypothetical protein